MHKPDSSHERAKQNDMSLTGERNNKQSPADIAMKKARKIGEKPAIFEKIILDPNWKSMATFTFIMVIFSMLSSMFAAYFACFGEPTGNLAILDIVMESCFVVDMVRSFFTSYTDPREPGKPVKDLFLIMKSYAKGPFFFDLVALLAWPLRLSLRDSLPEDDVGLIYLLKVFRISKILIVMDLQKFSINVRHRFRKQIRRVISN